MKRNSIGSQILSVFFAILICCCFPISAMATSYQQAPTQYTLNPIEQTQVSNYAQKFRQGLAEHKNSISVSVNPALCHKYGNTLISRIIYYHTLNSGTINGYPSSYISNSVKIPMTYHNDSNILEMKPFYYASWADETQARQYAQQIVKELKLKGTEQNQLIQITNYILKHYTYDWDKKRSSDSFAYVLKHKQTKLMCGGFSQLFYLMSQAAGISAIQPKNGYSWIWGTQYGPHAWLTYQIQGTKYVLDITTAIGNYYFDKKIPTTDKYLLPQNTANYNNRIPYNVDNVYNIEFN